MVLNARAWTALPVHTTAVSEVVAQSISPSFNLLASDCTPDFLPSF